VFPWLVVWAAIGVGIVTVSATAFHLVRGEMSSAAITLVLTAIAAFVAYARRRLVPISARETQRPAHVGRARPA
jgi:hypothetical protein